MSMAMVDADRGGGGPPPSRRPQLRCPERSSDLSGDGPPPSRRTQSTRHGRSLLTRSDAQRNFVDAERVRGDLQGILRHLELQSKRGSFHEFLAYVVGEDENDPPREAGKNAHHASAPKETNAQLRKQLSETQAELQHYKERYGKTNAEIQQLQSRRKSSEDRKGLCDDLAERVGALTDENDGLRSKCRKLEDGTHRHREEGAAMRGAMEEAARLITGMNDHVESLIVGHGECVKGYEEKPATLDEELDHAAASKEALATKNNSATAELQLYKEKYEMTNDEMQQLQSRCEMSEDGVDVSKGLYDDLVERAGALANENDGLRLKCRKLEEEENRHREEGAAMRRAMEETTRLITGKSVEEYEEELATPDEGLDRVAAATEALTKALEVLRGEHAVLTTQFEETKRARTMRR